MINYKLTLTENTAEALEANNAGELTEAQLNNLLQAIKKSRLPFSEFEDKSRFPSSLQIICMLVAFAGLTLFPNTMFALILLIGGLTGYVTIPIILMIRRDSAYHSQLEAVSHRLLKHDFTIIHFYVTTVASNTVRRRRLRRHESELAQKSMPPMLPLPPFVQYS